ncbi:MAG: potassium transporter Kup, partial [Gallionella sp.]
ILMRADNHGEGGSLALLALASDLLGKNSRYKGLLATLGIFAAALFYGDSMITPAISVLSAVEGLNVVAPQLSHYIVPITLSILTLLFLLQKQGTGLMGLAFGPIMIAWFACLGVLGGLAIVQHPQILLALNPAYAYQFLTADFWLSFLTLGAVVLAVTGGEALYTDMGHFGKFPIRLSWFGFVLPALVLNYFGQGALLLSQPAAIENPFFLLAPEWAMLPMVLLATAATVIASQAVISGAFSVAHQSVQMGFLPRMEICQTSDKAQGQIYVPLTNWTLYLTVVYLVLTFQNSSNLAAAYGIAVTGTMMIDTVLVTFVLVAWHWSPWLLIPLIGTLFCVDFAYFAANAIKIPQGGWFPLGIAVISFTVLTTWRRGRQLLWDEVKRLSIPIEAVVAGANSIQRVTGTAVFLVSEIEGAPAALLHNLKHNKILHQRNILLTIIVEDKPYVTAGNRMLIKKLGQDFFRVKLFYGFMETPDIPAALARCAGEGLPFDMMDTSFFMTRAMIEVGEKSGMARWRTRLFLVLSKNAMGAANFFKIPANRVIEMGTRIAI